MAQTKPATPTSPSPASAASRKPGRPAGPVFNPTHEQREMVRALTGYGIPQDQIAVQIKNPTPNRPAILSVVAAPA